MPARGHTACRAGVEGSQSHARLPAAAVILIQLPKRVRRRTGVSYTFTHEQMSEVLRAFRDGVLAREGLPATLEAIAGGAHFSHDTAPPPCTQKELEALVHDASVTLQHNLRAPHQRTAALMGIIMADIRGRAPGRSVAAMIEREGKEARS